MTVEPVTTFYAQSSIKVRVAPDFSGAVVLGEYVTLRIDAL